MNYFCQFVFFCCCPIICADLRGTALCCLSQHSPPPATPRACSALKPHPQRSKEEVRSLVGCYPKETLHCCLVTLVVFSSACRDWTYTGHHLLCPLLMTMLAKLWSQTKWTSHPESRPPLCPSTNPPMWTLSHWGLWSELSQAREEGGTPRLRPPCEQGMKGYRRSWDLIILI